MTAPYFEDIAQGPAGSAQWAEAQDGRRIRVVTWPCGGAAGTVFVLTGRTEYAEKYGPVALDLAARGYAAVAIDWRGQGMADRLIAPPEAGHVGRFADYQLDLAAALEAAADLPRPWYMLAHSMGGCIGLRALMGDHPFEKAAFSAPMWGIKLPPLLGPVARGIADLAHRMGAGARLAPGQSRGSAFLQTTFENNLLTTDAPTYDWLRSQLEAHPELILGGPTLGWLREALGECDALAALPAPKIPALAFLGTDEQIVSPARIKARMAGWTAPKGELVMLDGLRHEVLMEAAPKRQSILDRMVGFFAA